jgi:hypothetical protein
LLRSPSDCCRVDSGKSISVGRERLLARLFSSLYDTERDGLSVLPARF